MMMMKKFLILSLFLLFCVTQPLWQQEDLRKVADGYESKLTHKFKVEPGGLLDIRSVTGDVTVDTWNKKLVEIQETCTLDVFTKTEAQEILKRIQTSYEQVGNTIRIERKEISRKRIHSSFVITVPSAFDLKIVTIGGDLTIRNTKGKVELKTTGGDIKLTQVDGDVKASSAGGTIELQSATGEAVLSTAGGDIELEDVKGPVRAKTAGGDIEIRIVKSDVTAKTAGGDITLEQIGGNIDARTAGGSIDVVNCKGSIGVKTAGGDIEVRQVQGNTEAKTSGGDIQVDDIEGGIEAETSGGDVTLDNVRGFIEAKTSAGNIEAKMTLKDFSKDHHVLMKTSAGDLTLYLPEKLPATIQAIIHKKRQWSDYSIKSDFPLTYSEDEDQDREGRYLIRSSGDINGGGDLIQLETSEGNIKIRKLL